jgi:ubiquinone/menaquinone biosynthesis C-methylase UbiE
MARRPTGADPVLEDTYDHYLRDDVVSEYASLDFLLVPEEVIVEEFRPSLADARMLDLGVGAGRTTAHFAEAAKEYVGVDFSSKMIDACERRFAQKLGPSLTFMRSDARDLSALGSESFDFVLFSFNGLDTVGGDEDRLKVLREVHRVLREGGIFCFSSFNFAFAEEGFSLRKGFRDVAAMLRKSPALLVRRPRSVVRTLVKPLKWRRLNASRRELARLGHGVILEKRPRYSFSREFYSSPGALFLYELYYIRPQAQIDQLAGVGFDGTRILAPDGSEVTAASASGLAEWWWLYYLCTKRARPDA